MKMNKTNLTAAVLAVYAAASVSAARAWKSAPLLAHTNIMHSALERVDKAAYPDLDDFKVVLLEGANDESWHTLDSPNGGNPEDIWFGEKTETAFGVLGNYAALDLEHAYRRIGSICHLTEDQASPPHAANVYHGLTDRFETSAANHSAPLREAPAEAGAKEPYAYYQETQDDTRGMLRSWVNPDTGRPYWVEDRDSGVALGQDSTYGIFGGYGAGKDSFPLSSDNERAAPIVDRQYQLAARATLNVLISASKRLPPIVSDLSTVVRGGNIEIDFNAGDNRSSQVSYQIGVYQHSRLLGLIKAGELELNRHGTHGMTMGAKVQVIWDGTVEGKKLPAGDYVVQVTLTDSDNNTTPEGVNTDKSRVNSTKAYVSLK
ncbi:MAG: hypothetical protein WCW52_03755 [Elusimicrobiales bacterium]|jgi:hypothetical protein